MIPTNCYKACKLFPGLDEMPILILLRKSRAGGFCHDLNECASQPPCHDNRALTNLTPYPWIAR